VTTRLDLERYAVHLVMEEDRALGRWAAVGERDKRLQVLDFNPATHGVSNLQRRPKKKRPFESWSQIEAIRFPAKPLVATESPTSSDGSMPEFA
jgi:hypothetical protein